ncbi:MAG: NADH-quinone oxidoreductase subunit NuoF [Anaerolineae bacterium]|nr:MAG: NADH-quinone oxidoreductase subunit NuoF [Anaerolineae bacterium]
MAHLLLRHRDIPGLNNIEVYKQNGGFRALEKAVTTMQPKQVMEEVKASGLRGRGGAGFPTGIKWSFLPDTIWPHYVVCNADESEPGTFKDREIMEGNPYQFLEGVALACYAVGATEGYIYIRGEYYPIAKQIEACIAEMEKQGYLGDKLFGTATSIRLKTHLGAGAYICGEETALLESLEGKRGQPRLRPPFPAVVGLYGKPTVINNVETLTNLPFIVEHGAPAFREFGTEKSPGVKIFSLSGNVERPGNYELPLGTTFRELIFTHGGGIPNGRKLRAIMPAGASSSIIRVDETNFDKVMDTPMDYENVQSVGSLLGSASVIVIDDSHTMDWVIKKTIDFFQHESCGKCTPCRDGNYWMKHLTTRIHAGKASAADVKLLDSVAAQVYGKCLCALGDFSTMAVRSAIERFPEDFAKVTGKS